MLRLNYSTFSRQQTLHCDNRITLESIGDQVNGTNVANATHERTVQLIKQSGETIRLTILPSSPPAAAAGARTESDDTFKSANDCFQVSSTGDDDQRQYIGYMQYNVYIQLHPFFSVSVISIIIQSVLFRYFLHFLKYSCLLYYIPLYSTIFWSIVHSTLVHSMVYT